MLHLIKKMQKVKTNFSVSRYTVPPPRPHYPTLNSICKRCYWSDKRDFSNLQRWRKSLIVCSACQLTQSRGKSNKGLPWWESVPIKKRAPLNGQMCLVKSTFWRWEVAFLWKFSGAVHRAFNQESLILEPMHPSESVTVAIWLMHLYWIKREQK